MSDTLGQRPCFSLLLAEVLLPKLCGQGVETKVAVISQGLLTPAAELSKMLVKPADVMAHLRLAESEFLGRRLRNLHFKQAFQVIPKYVKFENNGFGYL